MQKRSFLSLIGLSCLTPLFSWSKPSNITIEQNKWRSAKITISIDTIFTKNILIPFTDKDGKEMLDLNNYGDLGQYISQVSLRSEKEMRISCSRFESNTIPFKDISTEGWREFNDKVTAYVNDHIQELYNNGVQDLSKPLVKLKL